MKLEPIFLQALLPFKFVQGVKDVQGISYILKYFRKKKLSSNLKLFENNLSNILS